MNATKGNKMTLTDDCESYTFELSPLRSRMVVTEYRDGEAVDAKILTRKEGAAKIKELKAAGFVVG